MVVALGTTFPLPGVAEDLIELESISIIGNRELPKTITIVPWKKAYPGETLRRPRNSVLVNTLAPVDRTVFLRELGYYRQLVPLPVVEPELANKNLGTLE